MHPTASHLLTWSSIALVSLLAIAGEVLIAGAMRRVGDLDQIRAHAGMTGAVRVVMSSPVFLLGAFCMALNFFAMLFTLSHVELSLAAPGIASFTYVGNAVAASYFLGEHVDRRRWIACLCVAMGVFLLTR